MKFKIKKNESWEEVATKLETPPIGSILEFNGATPPQGWKWYYDDATYKYKTLWETDSWDSMLTPYTKKYVDLNNYDYVEVHFTGQGGTNATNIILKADLNKAVKNIISWDGIDYSYGASTCFPDIQLLWGYNDDPGIFRIGFFVSYSKYYLWVGDTGYFSGKTDSGNFDSSGRYARVSKIVGIKKITKIIRTS